MLYTVLGISERLQSKAGNVFCVHAGQRRKKVLSSSIDSKEDPYASHLLVGSHIVKNLYCIVKKSI